jgi:hypothetical protein
MLRSLKTPGIYCPKASVRLLSNTALLKAYVNEMIALSANDLIVRGNQDSEQTTNSIIAQIDPRNNLPTSQAISYSSINEIPEVLNHTVDVVNDANKNITPAEKEWLKWHFRLGHMSFRHIQFLMRTGVLAKSQQKRHMHTAVGKLTSPPKCAACQFAKARRKSTSARKYTYARVNDTVTGSLKQNTLMAGEEVSIDHFICSKLGRL